MDYGSVRVTVDVLISSAEVIQVLLLVVRKLNIFQVLVRRMSMVHFVTVNEYFTSCSDHNSNFRVECPDIFSLLITSLILITPPRTPAFSGIIGLVL